MGDDREQLGKTSTQSTPTRFQRNLRTSVVDRNGLIAIAFGLFIVLIIFAQLSVPSRIPILGVARPTILLVALISLIIFVSLDQLRGKDTSNTTRHLNLLLIYIIVTIPFVEWPGSVLRSGIEAFARAVVFFYFTVYLVDSYRKLRILIMAVVVCEIIRVLEPLYLHLTIGYWGDAAHMVGSQFLERLAGAPSDIINPNGLAFVILTALPFMHYLLGGSPRALIRVLYLVLLPPVLYALLLTGSRSGLIGLLVEFTVIFYRSKHRVLLGMIAVVTAVVALSLMGADMKDRYLSIVDENTLNAATSEGRIDAIWRDFKVGMRRPIVGHGLGTSREALFNEVGVDLLSHNLYTEVLIELGFIGLILFLPFIFSIFVNVRSVGVEKAKLEGVVLDSLDPATRDRLAYYGRCEQAVFVLFAMCLVFSLASYGLSRFSWYLVAGLSVALRNLITVEGKRLTSA